MQEKVDRASVVPPPRRHNVAPAMLRELHDWLLEQALDDADLAPIVYGCCERLQAAGLPLIRGYFAFSVLHPLHSAIGITWMRGEGSSIADYPHVPKGINPGFAKSPHYHMIQRGLATLRIHLDADQHHYTFPILDDLRQEGVTDYLAFTVEFEPGRGNGMLGSWATDHGAGFSDEDIEVLLQVQRTLAVATKMAIKNQLMRNLVKTYLGKHAGKRVLKGRIKRGDAETIKAAIWYADLRRSTVMADTMTREEFIETLNTFFDATGGAVTQCGGQILSFIGDAILAIFPVDDKGQTPRIVCDKALMAASLAGSRIHETNAIRGMASKSPLEFGVGLHLGEVTYGNVGIPSRLSFSVFGSAVNEVVRLDGLTKSLGEPVLVTKAFADAVEHEWRDLGKHKLRGITRRMSVFAPGFSTIGKPAPFFEIDEDEDEEVT
ncbi:MAG: adenylate/guanylate cyclase domain-containing protein [Hyphomicrobiaceae bacterium]